MYDNFYPADCSTPRRILYLISQSKIVCGTLLPKLTADLNCSIDIFNSLNSLMVKIDQLSEIDGDMPLILMDADYLFVEYSSATEIIDMLSSRHKCMIPARKMHLAIVVETDRDRCLVKQIKETAALGIVPCEKTFGYTSTLNALKQLKEYRQHWPAFVMPEHHAVHRHSTSGLTNRQKEVLGLVSHRGLSNKKIAKVLKISESTVKIHMTAILKEYGVRNRTQLALAVTSSLIA